MEIIDTHESLYASSLIKASLDPMFVISPAGKVPDVNQATVDVTGKSRKSLQVQISSINLPIRKKRRTYMQKN